MAILTTPLTAMRHTHGAGVTRGAMIPASSFTIRGKNITTSGTIPSFIIALAPSIRSAAAGSMAVAVMRPAVVAMAVVVVTAVVVSREAKGGREF
jgi:hypothetical protein